jgi:hypothetical protein
MRGRRSHRRGNSASKRGGRDRRTAQASQILPAFRATSRRAGFSSRPTGVRVAVGSTFVNIMCSSSSRAITAAASRIHFRRKREPGKLRCEYFAKRASSHGQRILLLISELDVFERRRQRARPGRTQRMISSFVMSSSQSLTTTEMLGFRFLIAVFARTIALVRWFQGEVRNVRRGDRCPPCVLFGPGWWALAPLGGQPCAPIVPVLGNNAWGGREGPAARRLPRLVLFPDRLSPSHPHSAQAADPGGWEHRVDLS